MLMHKASPKNIFACDALSGLGLSNAPAGEFDLVATNPPFSVKLSSEERNHLKSEYTLLQGASKVASEHLFLERWYKLLREDGRLVAVVPESLMDTKANRPARKFLYQNFNLEAVIALPEVTFLPYTGTRTVVLLARKKTAAEALLWEAAMERAVMQHGTDEEACFQAALHESAGSAKVFMAEPQAVGYTRAEPRIRLPLNFGMPPTSHYLRPLTPCILAMASNLLPPTTTCLQPLSAGPLPLTPHL